MPIPPTVLLQHNTDGRLTAVTDRVSIQTFKIEDDKQAYTAPLSHQQNATSKRVREGVTAETVAKRQKAITTKAYIDKKVNYAAWNHQDPSAESHSTRAPKGESQLV
jgi:hypothetical protein